MLANHDMASQFSTVVYSSVVRLQDVTPKNSLKINIKKTVK